MEIIIFLSVIVGLFLGSLHFKIRSEKQREKIEEELKRLDLIFAQEIEDEKRKVNARFAGLQHFHDWQKQQLYKQRYDGWVSILIDPAIYLSPIYNVSNYGTAKYLGESGSQKLIDIMYSEFERLKNESTHNPHESNNKNEAIGLTR